MTALSRLYYVGGKFDLSNNELTNLDGLDTLNNVDNGFDLSDNTLQDISGISNLGSVTNDIDFRNNNLTNIDGLSGLRNVNGSIYLNNNPNLTDISGLRTLIGIDEGESIYFDTGITEREGFVGLPADAWLCYSSKAVFIENNGNLQENLCQ